MVGCAGGWNVGGVTIDVCLVLYIFIGGGGFVDLLKRRNQNKWLVAVIPVVIGVSEGIREINDRQGERGREGSYV